MKIKVLLASGMLCLTATTALAYDPNGTCLWRYQPQIDLATGKREFVRELMPSDSAGVASVGPVCILPDQNSYVFGYQRVLSDLHVVQGLK